MSRNEIVDRLKDILIDTDERQAAQIETCGENLRLTTDLGLSSVGMLYMVIAIVESFGVIFENVSMGDCVTLRDGVDYLEARLG